MEVSKHRQKKCPSLRYIQVSAGENFKLPEGTPLQSFYLRARDEWENLVSSCSWLDSQDGQPGSEDQAAMNHFVTLFTHTASHRTKPPRAGLYKAKLEERRSRRPARLAEDGQRSVGHVYMWHLGRRDCLCCYWNARHPTLDSFTVSSQYTGKVATSSQILDAGRSAQNASAPLGSRICYLSDSTSCAETPYSWAGCENITRSVPSKHMGGGFNAD